MSVRAFGRASINDPITISNISGLNSDQASANAMTHAQKAKHQEAPELKRGCFSSSESRHLIMTHRKLLLEWAQC